MIARFDFAPLDGITKRVFRRVWHKHFGGADRYFVPSSPPRTSTSSPPGTAGSWRTRRIFPRSPR